MSRPVIPIPVAVINRMDKDVHPCVSVFVPIRESPNKTPENARRPARLCMERKVARCVAGTRGAIAAFMGAVMKALGTDRNNISPAIR